MIEVMEQDYIAGLNGTWPVTDDVENHGSELREQFIALMMGWA